MKITVGIHNASEIENLALAGADEFFCGFVPKEWIRRFGPGTGPNRRELLGANVLTYQDLKYIIREAHRFSKKIFINFNAHYFPKDTLPLIKKMILKCIEYEADGITLADPGILFKLKDWKINANIILSGEIGIRNSYDINFFAKNFNISRIILPRYSCMWEVFIIISKIFY